MGASTNRTGIAIAKESVWGTNPGTALQNVNFTGEGLAFNISNITSNTIRPDRQVADLIQTGAECSGNLDFELQYGGYDALIAAALFSAWAGVGDDQETITSGATAGSLDFVVSVAGSSITLGSAVVHNIVEGQYFRLKGAATNNNKIYQATDVTGNVITVSPAPGTNETLDETDLAVISGSMLRNGSDMSSFWIERAHEDVTQFFQYAGMVVNTFSLDFSANAVLTGSFNFIGKNAGITQVSSGTGSNVDAATTDFMNAVANVGNVRVDGVAVTGCLLQQVTIEVNNNVRGLASIGQLGFCDITEGEIGITGSMNLYFNDETYYEKYINAESFSYDFRVSDLAGNTYIFTVPKCKFSSDAVNAGGKNADVMENTNYQAIMGAGGFTIQIDRIPA